MKQLKSRLRYVVILMTSTLLASTGTLAQSLVASSNYTGGSGDHTNVSNAPLKIESTSGYFRIPHISQSSTISGVYNFQAGKSVYWGEPGDGGQYIFRGRHITVENGGVAIGVPGGVPTAKLEVNGATELGSATNSTVLLMTLSGTNNTNYFRKSTWLRRDNTGNPGWMSVRLHEGFSIDGVYGTPGVDTRNWYERSPFRNIHAWGDLNITQMILKEGKLGIGTLNPDFPLTVNGSIKAKEVLVTVDVPGDYVFEKDYNLMPLAEVEKYVDAEKHLPNIPSAADLKASGYNVGDMSNMMMVKIEELTLYMIELKKENEALRKSNEELSQRVRKIENR